MDDLRVENYDEKEVVTKKRSILKRAAVVGGVIVTVLGLFGLVSCINNENRTERSTSQGIERHPPAPGGSGSWFVSILESV